MTFNIGSQSGGVFNNVAGNQTVYGGQQAYTGAEQSLHDLRAALARLPLSPGTAAATVAEIDEIERSVQAGPAGRSAAGQALERLTRLLTGAGALATAGSALIEPLRGLATWLGPAASHVLMLLPR